METSLSAVRASLLTTSSLLSATLAAESNGDTFQADGVDTGWEATAMAQPSTHTCTHPPTYPNITHRMIAYKCVSVCVGGRHS